MRTIIKRTESRKYTDRLTLRMERIYLYGKLSEINIKIFIKGSRTQVGRIGIDTYRGMYGNESNLGYSLLGREHEGKGYMTEAISCILSLLKRYNIQACCYDNNKKSDKILSRFYTHKKVIGEDGAWGIVNCYSFNGW